MCRSDDCRPNRFRCRYLRLCAAVLAAAASIAVAPASDAGAIRAARPAAVHRVKEHHPAKAHLVKAPSPKAPSPKTHPAAVSRAPVTSAARGRIALNFALAQRGKPYVYGGTGPAVYDCSGLVQRAWRVAGVAIPRTTQQQARTGKAVPLSQIRPGDLVIFYHDASHVGIYAGGGKVVVAPHQGARVTLEPMKWMPIYAVRRPG